MMRILLCLLFQGLLSSLFAQAFVPGQSYFGANNYVEYIAGNMPIVLSAPHGGLLTPAAIPDRDCSGCTTVNDFNTQELGRAVANALHARTGCWPHLVINRLHRRKLDANRDLPEAADGNAIAGQAWMDFHDFLGAAKNQAAWQFGKGFYVDLHGHAHTIQRLELGYLLYSDELQLADSILNKPTYIGYSSIRNLVYANPQALSHAALLRGELSLGSMLAAHGYPATPSMPDPYPEDTEDYFSGGYNTARYSSYTGGAIDGVQIECNRTGVRDNQAEVERFADSLAVVLLEYLQVHYFGTLTETLCANVGSTGPNNPWQMEIAPNPYCRSFYVAHADSSADWEAEVFDFNGNLMLVQTVTAGNPIKFSFAEPKNVFVVLRRNGEIVAAKAVLHYCR